MRSAIVTVVTIIALLATVTANPRKVLVLPLDGNAAPEQKAQLNDALQRLAKSKLTGDVTVGDTTFAETAAAVGCDPSTPACVDTVLTTLSVDEIVYGDATTADGSTTVTVHRATMGGAPKTQVSVIGETDAGDKAEAGITPVFEDAPAVDPNLGVGPGSAVAERPRAQTNFFDTRERKLGVALAGGGVIALAIGLSYWSSKSSLQEQIDNHPNRTLADIESLKALEDRAASKALWGNILVVLGLGVGGAGAYYLYKDHENRKLTVTPEPVPAGTGMSFVLRGRW